MSILLTALMLLLGAPGAAFAADPVAVPDGSLDAVDSILGTYASQQLGYDVAYDDDVVVMSAPLAVAPHVVVYRRTAAGLSAEATITAPEGGQFGYSVDVSGDTLVVGAPGVNSNDGKAYFYHYSAGLWSLETSLAGPVARAGRAGMSVSVESTTAIVGAPQTNAARGSVQILSELGAGWAQSGFISSGSIEQFGAAVAAGDGLVAMGAPLCDTGMTDRGRVAWFRWDGSGWVSVTSIVGSAGGIQMGYSLAMDGDNIAAGAPYADIGGTNTGAVYVFDASTSGASPGTVIAGATRQSNEHFGRSVDVKDGVLTVGAQDYTSGTGRAFAYAGNLTSWTQLGIFQAPNATSGRYFGNTVATQGDSFFVGEYWNSDLASRAGAVHEFSAGWYTTAEDTTLTVGAPGLLEDDFDLDGDPLSAYLVSGASDGTVTVNADGSFQYVPDTDFEGWDTFTYRAYDGSGYSDPVVASIRVTPLPDAPEFIAGASVEVTCTEDEIPVPFSLTLTVDDPDVGDTISWSRSVGPLHGLATVGGTGLSKAIIYDPSPDYHGTDSFVVRATDSLGASDDITVTVTIDPINDAPTFNLGTPYNIDEDGGYVEAPAWATAISPGPADEATQALSANTVNDNPALFSVQPSVSVTGTLTFESAPNAHGSATVAVGITDDDTAGAPGSITTTHTMTINVASVNDTPTPAPDSYSTEEDGGLLVAQPGVLINDTDIENDPLTAVMEDDVSNGSLFLFGNGSFIYTPDAGWSGIDTFTYRAWDGDLYSNPTTVTIDVGSVNDEPVIDQGGTTAITTAEDTSVDTTLTAMDADGDSLTWTVVGAPSNGTASVSSADTTGVVTYTPDADYNGADAFTVQVSDGVGGTDLIVVTVDVTPVNDAPVAGDLYYEVDEDGILLVPAPGLTVGASDVDGTTPFVTMYGYNPELHGNVIINFLDGSFIYTPDPDYNGPATFRYWVEDGSLMSNEGHVNITVLPVNDAPTATDDSFSLVEDQSYVSTGSVLANDGDIDGDQLTAVLQTPAAHGIVLLQADGTFLYTPLSDFHGTDTFTYRAFDGTAFSAPTTVTISVAPSEDDPVIDQGALSLQTTAEDTTLTVGFSATDPDGDLLTWMIVDQADDGVATCGGVGTATTVTYVPDPDYNGDDAFSVAVMDMSGRSDVIAVRVNVTPVNDAPVVVPLAYETAEDTTITVLPPGLFEGYSDIDGDPAMDSLVSPTADTNGTLTDFGGGQFVYLGDTDFNGDASFTYQVFDGLAWSNSATVTVTVTPVNDAPSFMPGTSVSVAEDCGPATFAAWATAIDTGAANEAQALSFEVANDDESLFSVQPAISATGTLSFTPAPNANGTATVSAVLIDDDTAGGPALESATATFTIEITPVNDVPEAIDDAFEVAEDTTLTVPALGVLDNDVDIDGDTLSASLETSPTHGVLSLSADGSFTYAPEPDYNGTDAFAYRASDTATSSAPATVTITVTPVNDAPIAFGEAYELAEDTTLHVVAPGLLANDTDIDGDVLGAVVATTTAHGTLAVELDGGFTYTPESGWSGADTFTYCADDGELSSASVTVTLTVAPMDTVYTPVAGKDRFATAVAASRLAYSGTCDTVIIATAYNWPDALSGSSLAGATDAPILLTRKAGVPDVTIDEIERLGAGKVYVLGGTAAVSADAIGDLEAVVGSGNVTRIAGADRYETARMVAEETIAQLGADWDGRALVTTGRDFPDAITASPMAVSTGWPILLVNTSGPTTDQVAAWKSLSIDHAVILGGAYAIPHDAEAVLAAGGVTSERVSGSDRYSTSLAIAKYGANNTDLTWTVLGVASGVEFPDALVGGVACASRGGILVLSKPDTLTTVFRNELVARHSEIEEVLFLGGTSAVSTTVRDEIRNVLR